MKVPALALLTLLTALRARVGDCVALLRGVAGVEASNAVMEAAIAMQGFRTVQKGYRSTSAPAKDLARDHVGPAVAHCGTDRVRFVTHLMGGLLARIWLAGNQPAEMGHVVNLALLNCGAELVNDPGDLALFAWAICPAALDPGTCPNALPDRLPPADISPGVLS